MRIDEVLDIIKKEVEESKICESLVLFGSAVYDKNPNDIDLILYRKKFIHPIEFIRYIEFMDYLDKKYKDFGFAFSSGKPRKKDYKIEVAFLPYFEFMGSIEKEFAKEVYETHIVLFGKDPFDNYKEINTKDIISKINFVYGNKINSNYFKIKLLLRVGLIYLNKHLEKRDLLKSFELNYGLKVSSDLIDKFKGKVVEDKLLGKDVENIYNCIKSRILKENPKFQDKIYYPKKFLKMYEIYRDLRILWKEENIDKIKAYLTIKEKELKEL